MVKYSGNLKNWSNDISMPLGKSKTPILLFSPFHSIMSKKYKTDRDRKRISIQKMPKKYGKGRRTIRRKVF